jgi:hypothetical protein
MAKLNCWEVKKCGRQPGGEKVEEFGICPTSENAEADGINDGTNAGRICWAVTGTFCGGKKQGTFANKRMNCMTCEFYKSVKQDERAEFNLLMPGQTYKVNEG